MDACRDCSVPREIRDVLVGHSNQTVAAEYGSEKYPMRPLFEAMERVQYSGLDLTHLYRSVAATRARTRGSNPAAATVS